MPHSRLSDDEISRRGAQIYRDELLGKIEDANIGKLVSFDVETGDYEIGFESYSDLDAPLRLHARHPDAAIYTLRIGYNAVVAVGGESRSRSDIQQQSYGKLC